MKSLSKQLMLTFVCLFLIGCNRNASISGVDYEWSFGGGAGVVDGIVVSRSGTTPVAGLTIFGASTSGDISTTTDDQGVFQLIVGERELLEIGITGSRLKKTISCTKGLSFVIQID